jgi:hypothetical protein
MDGFCARRQGEKAMQERNLLPRLGFDLYAVKSRKNPVSRDVRGNQQIPPREEPTTVSPEKR